MLILEHVIGYGVWLFVVAAAEMAPRARLGI